MFAIVTIAGKQYKVKAGDVISVDRLRDAVGKTITLPRVHLTSDNGKVKVGKPTLAGIAVTAKILSHDKGEKVSVRRFKAKSRYRRARGFRPSITKLSIVSIGTAK